MGAPARRPDDYDRVLNSGWRDIAELGSFRARHATDRRVEAWLGSFYAHLTAAVVFNLLRACARGGVRTHMRSPSGGFKIALLRLYGAVQFAECALILALVRAVSGNAPCSPW